MDGSAKPAEKPNPNPNAKDDNDDNDRPWNPPAAQGWSQSEIGGGSQPDPWSGPGRTGNRPGGAKSGPSERRNPNPPKPAWGNGGEGRDWTTSELGVDDSVSQRGDEGFRTAPSKGPGEKSWADQVEDEIEYANGDEPAPMVAPAPDLEGDGGDGSDNGWVDSGRGKGKGKGRGKGGGRGKAKSATGWSDVSNQGFW
jgi:hypothetical protein